MRGLIRRFAMAAATLLLALPVAFSASAASAGTVSQAVPGFSGALTGVACPTASTCVAVGNTIPGLQPVVVTITKGVPGPPQVVPGSTVLLAGVDCATTTSCLAVGSILSSGQGAVVPITNGIPAAPQTVANTPLLNSIACPSATTCYAVGGPTPLANPGGAVIVPITNGTAGTAVWAGGTDSLNSVSCASVKNCVAVGYAGLFVGTESVVVPLTNGSPGGTQDIGTGKLEGVSCASAASCQAVGYQTSPTSIENKAIVVPITNGTAGSPEVVAGITQLNAVGCASVASCQAVSDSAVIPITNGIPGAAQASGMSTLAGVACPSATRCYTVGGSSVGTISAVDSTAMSVACSPAQGLLVGQPTTCTATVTDPASPPSTPTGTVNFSSNGVGSFTGNPCPLSGTGRVASCSVTYSLGAASGQEITASYGGDSTHAAAKGTADLVPMRIPGKPVITGVTAGNGQATVSFTPAQSDQSSGNPVTSYTVIVRAGVNVSPGRPPPWPPAPPARSRSPG